MENRAHSAPRRMCLATVAASLLAISSPNPAIALPILSIDLGGNGSSAIIAPGESVTATIVAGDIPTGTDGLGMFGFGWSLMFDGSGITGADPLLGALFTATGLSELRNAQGEVALTANRFFQSSGPAGNFDTSSVVLTGVSPGVYDLTMSVFTGPGDNVLFDGTILDGSAGFFGTGQLTVVPEPGAGLLALIGFIGLALRTRP